MEHINGSSTCLEAPLNAVFKGVSSLEETNVGTTVSAINAILNVSSQNKGVLLPRMTQIQMNAISTPTQGLLIFNTSTNTFNFYNGSNWAPISSSSILFPLAIEYFGGGVNVADNSVPLQNAINQGYKSFIFGQGNYTFLSTITINMANNPNIFDYISIQGCGSNVSSLNFTNCDGFVINLNGPKQSVIFKGLSLKTTVINTRACITCNQSWYQGVCHQSIFEDLTFEGIEGGQDTTLWGWCIRITNLSQINFISLLCYGSSNPSLGVGVELKCDGVNPQIGQAYNFTACSFYNLNFGLIYGTQIQGVTVTQGNFVNCTNGIYAPPGITGCSQLHVSDTNIDTFGNGINIIGPISDVNIHHCLFYIKQNQAGVYLAEKAHFTFSGNFFGGIGSVIGNSGIIIAGNVYSEAGCISGNTFFSMANGIVLNAGVNNTKVGLNYFNVITTPIINAGSNNSLFDYSSTATSISFTGLSAPQSLSVAFDKIGNSVTMRLPNIIGTGNSTFIQCAAGAIPSGYRPPQPEMHPIIVYNNNVASVSRMNINADGSMFIYSSASGANFGTDPNSGLQRITLTYQVI
jgi:hypothetical protein